MSVEVIEDATPYSITPHPEPDRRRQIEMVGINGAVMARYGYALGGWSNLALGTPGVPWHSIHGRAVLMGATLNVSPVVA